MSAGEVLARIAAGIDHLQNSNASIVHGNPPIANSGAICASVSAAVIQMNIQTAMMADRLEEYANRMAVIVEPGSGALHTGVNMLANAGDSAGWATNNFVEGSEGSGNEHAIAACATAGGSQVSIDEASGGVLVMIEAVNDARAALAAAAERLREAGASVEKLEEASALALQITGSLEDAFTSSNTSMEHARAWASAL